MSARVSLAGLALIAAGCATAGSAWMEQPLTGSADELDDPSTPAAAPAVPAARARLTKRTNRTNRARVLGETDDPREPGTPPNLAKVEGRVLGSFRNTYYDFPNERDHEGANVKLFDAKCQVIKEVPRGFYESVCVQGSGTLSTGPTVSFARRDCECAEVCPRTQQKICFESLDASRFPWGRGATGQPITPLLTVAVDSDVIPLGTAVYVPELDGMPRDAEKTAFHDGCFIAQDRGVRVKGKHIDVFTGHESVTKLWNGLVPSNQGVTVVLDSPRCARVEPTAMLPAEPTGER